MNRAEHKRPRINRRDSRDPRFQNPMFFPSSQSRDQFHSRAPSRRQISLEKRLVGNEEALIRRLKVRRTERSPRSRTTVSVKFVSDDRARLFLFARNFSQLLTDSCCAREGNREAGLIKRRWLRNEKPLRIEITVIEIVEVDKNGYKR